MILLETELVELEQQVKDLRVETEPFLVEETELVVAVEVLAVLDKTL
jgi:hypothetical protein